uniref:Uncharacterized protein n=1 Tax=viral metagenome TaxID=1070528 RepID=A0A6C0HAE9_9ZZZZ
MEYSASGNYYLREHMIPNVQVSNQQTQVIPASSQSTGTITTQSTDTTINLLADSLRLIIKDPNNNILVTQFMNFANLIADMFKMLLKQPKNKNILNAIDKHMKNLALELNSIARNL